MAPNNFTCYITSWESRSPTLERAVCMLGKTWFRKRQIMLNLSAKL